jgi:hypothetical protein
VALAQSTGAFTATGSMTTPRAYHTATLLPNGTVLIAGGSPSFIGGSHPLISTELYDPSAGIFTAAGHMNTARISHTATLLPNGKVLIAGGFADDTNHPGASALTSAELYDPSDGTFIPTGDMTAARAVHRATLLNNGKVLITGGVPACCTGPSNSAELYDPSTGTFAPAANMTRVAPCGRRDTLLPDGKVLIVDWDWDCPGPISAEVFDSESGTFTSLNPGPMFAATTASLLTDGKVLLTLGDSGGVGRLAELYDPATGTFVATGSLSTYRGQDSTATLLPDGTVLVDGHDFVSGLHYGDSVHNADLYDPATGTFSPVDGAQDRMGHTATLLVDGTVLIAGGDFGLNMPVSSAEVYHPAMLAPSPIAVQ